jgi:hypothetical protein
MVEPPIHMTKFIKEILGFIIFIAIVGGGLLVFRNVYHGQQGEAILPVMPEVLDARSEALKKYFLANPKPQHIEITNLSKRFEKDVQNFKKLKIPQDKASTFYISIQFFTDESDANAPLVAQIRFIEVKSGNTIKEESINL